MSEADADGQPQSPSPEDANRSVKILLSGGGAGQRPGPRHWACSAALIILRSACSPIALSGRCALVAGLAGAVSRTATAPVDRIKMLLQVQDSAEPMTIRTAFKQMASEGVIGESPRFPVYLPVRPGTRLLHPGHESVEFCRC